MMAKCVGKSWEGNSYLQAMLAATRKLRLEALAAGVLLSTRVY